MKASAVLKVSDTNSNDISKKLPNVNPSYIPQYGEEIDAGYAVSIKSACQSLNALTTNTFKGVNLEITEDITGATAPKPIPEFVIEGNWFDSVEEITQQTKITNSEYIMVNTNQSGGNVTMEQYSGFAGVLGITKNNNSEFSISKLMSGYGVIVKVTVAETATYAERSKYQLFVTE